MAPEQEWQDRNGLLVPGARSALERLKLETAAELGVPNYEGVDKGDLPARLNGAVGGHMVRKLLRLAEQQLQGLRHRA